MGHEGSSCPQLCPALPSPPLGPVGCNQTGEERRSSHPRPHHDRNRSPAPEALVGDPLEGTLAAHPVQTLEQGLRAPAKPRKPAPAQPVTGTGVPAKVGQGGSRRISRLWPVGWGLWRILSSGRKTFPPGTQGPSCRLLHGAAQVLTEPPRLPSLRFASVNLA